MSLLSFSRRQWDPRTFGQQWISWGESLNSCARPRTQQHGSTRSSSTTLSQILVAAVKTRKFPLIFGKAGVYFSSLSVFWGNSENSNKNKSEAIELRGEVRKYWATYSTAKWEQRWPWSTRRRRDRTIRWTTTSAVCRESKDLHRSSRLQRNKKVLCLCFHQKQVSPT